MSKWCLVLLLVCLVGMANAGHRRYGDRHRQRQRDRSYVHQRFHLGRNPLQASLSFNHRWDDMANSFNWFESDRYNPFLSSFFTWGSEDEKHKSWWQGPHVCEKKTEVVKNATEQEGQIMVHYSTNSQQCDESEEAYKCHMVEENVEGRREVTVVYECCHGYSREKGEFGCPKKLQMKNLIDKAQDLGLTEFLQAIKMLQLTKQMKTGNFTVFAPINGAFGLDSDLMEIGSSVVLKDSPAIIEISEPALEKTLQTLQGAILGHTVAGAHRSSSLNDEQVLDTGHLEGSTIRINYFSRPTKLMTANCIPVVSRDNMATNGVIHTVEKALKPVTDTLLDLVRTRPDLTLLKTVLSAAEYVPKLEEDGKYTLLAPTNGAFRKLNRRLRERLLSGDKKCIESVLLNHMLPNVICSATFQKNTRTKNLMNKYLNVVRNDDDKLFVNEAQVVSKDIMGLNGVMHIIDDVLIPEEALSLLDVLEQKGLTELITLVEVAGLTKTLDSAKNVTLFAPSNEAIKNLPLGYKSKLSSDKDLLKKVLTYHISPAENSCMHFKNNQLIPSLEGRQVRLNRYTTNPFYQGTRTAQCAPILDKNTKTCNGQLNVLSQVMIPPLGNVIDVLAADKRFTSLVSYLKKADLVQTLQQDGPFTVFAPNNKAFDKLDKRTLEGLLRNTDQLANLLKAHVFESNLCCAGITRHSWFGGQYIRTLSGAILRLSRNRRGDPIISHNKIIKCDRTATNGNILEMDQVLSSEVPNWKGHHNRNNRRRSYFQP